jgi:hypothetical protein
MKNYTVTFKRTIKKSYYEKSRKNIKFIKINKMHEKNKIIKKL